MLPLRAIVFVAALICLCGAGDSNSTFAFPPGSPRRCLTNTGHTIPTFEVLAGGGWDNLRNLDMSMIMKLSYSRCRTTDDGRYLIPDNLYTIPVKSSKFEKYVELFEHWDDYKSTTSNTINVHAGASYDNVAVSGKFSDEYENVKSRQYNDKSVTTRVQVRYVRYVAKLAPGSGLSDEFRRRLRKIGAHIRLNRTQSARYESQTLVRDFGTHVITNIDVGAILSQVDNIQSSSVLSSESHKREILVSASVSFYNTFNFGIDYSTNTSNEMMEKYQNETTSSNIETWGGPVFRPDNFTAGDWSKAIENDMVAIDRSGDPIYFLISDDTLPDVPTSTVIHVRDYVKEAVELYYKHNTYRGCTRQDSPNFSFQSNADDGTCMPTDTNYTFGGVYQSCQNTGYTDLCAKMRQKNPMTDDYSCPSGYKAIQIQDESTSVSMSQHECHRFLLVFHRCKDVTITATAHYTAYWCAATGPVPQNSGFLFGGLYTGSVSNLVNRGASCPAEFYSLNILEDLTICVSDDYELGTPNALPFAGFFSCKSGNPLALKANAGLLKSGKSSKIKAFIMESGESKYPKGCPEGFSQHLAVNDRGCEVNYCVQSGVLTPKGLPAVHLPPFMKIPDDEPASSNDIIFMDDGTLWTDMNQADNVMPAYLKSHGYTQQVSSDIREKLIGTGIEDESGRTSDFGKGRKGLSVGGVAAISVVVTLICVVAVMIIGVVVWKRRRGRYQAI